MLLKFILEMIKPLRNSKESFISEPGSVHKSRFGTRFKRWAALTFCFSTSKLGASYKSSWLQHFWIVKLKKGLNRTTQKKKDCIHPENPTPSYYWLKAAKAQIWGRTWERERNHSLSFHPNAKIKSQALQRFREVWIVMLCSQGTELGVLCSER